MKKNLNFLIFAIMGALLLSGCITKPYKSEKTSIELQGIQSKEFKTTKRIAFASVLSVLQDLGYIIETGDFDTGLITGKSPTGLGTTLFAVLQKYRKATAFVELSKSSHVKIRLNFVDITTTSSSYGQETRKDLPLEDNKLYQDVFDEIRKAIFVRSNIN